MNREENLGQQIHNVENKHKFGTFIIGNIKIGGLSWQGKKTMTCSELTIRNKGEEREDHRRYQ